MKLIEGIYENKKIYPVPENQRKNSPIFLKDIHHGNCYGWAKKETS